MSGELKKVLARAHAASQGKIATSKADLSEQIKSLLGDRRGLYEEILKRIQTIFGTGTPTMTQLRGGKVWVVICVDKPEWGRERLDAFDEEFWIDACAEANGRLQVTIEHV